MVGRPCATGGDANLARFGPRQRNQLEYRLHRHRRVDHQKILLGSDQHHRHKVVGVVGQLVIDRRRIRDADTRQQQRITIGNRGRHRLRGDRAATATAVVDHNRLAPQIAGFLRSDPRDDVGSATRRERYEQADGTLRIVGGRVTFLRRPGLRQHPGGNHRQT